jgi:hypothetical protein
MLTTAFFYSNSYADSPIKTGLGLKKVTSKLRVESGLLSVKLTTGAYKKRSRGKRNIRKQKRIEQTRSPLKIAIFTNDRLLRMRECGDQQCLIKLSEEESHQLLSQYLHTNLPQRTNESEGEGRNDTLMGPLPSLKVGLLNDQAVATLAVEAQGQGQGLDPE